jgi:hypothetical protein
VLPSRFPGQGGGAQFSPDGQWVIYGHDGDIMGRRTSGDTAEVALVRDPITQSGAALSPDGRWLAYASDETGTYQVYVRPFPDTKVAKRQVSTSLGFAARWSRSGRELFFMQNDEAGTRSLWAVDVLPAAAFTTGIPRPLFDATPYGPTATNYFDVSVDGKRFLLTRSVGSGDRVASQDRLVIVQNFLTELRAKVR